MILTYTNAAGYPITIRQRGPFWLERIDGINAVDVNIGTYTNVGADGVGVSSETYEPRSIILSGVITNNNRKSEMIRVLGQKGEGALEIGDRYIRCRVQNFSQPKDLTRRRWSWKFIISLFCPYPFFQSLAEVEKKILSWESAWRFPFVLPEERSFLFGSRSGNGSVVVTNEGQVECPVTITMRFTGTTVNPQIKVLETGDAMRFSTTFNSGDVLDIDTYQGRKDVRLNGATNLNIMDDDSVFLKLPQGESTIEYAADAGVTAMEVWVRYRMHYLGGVE